MEKSPAPLSPEQVIYNKLLQMLETNPSLKFTISGVSNITGRQGGDTKGQRLFQYNNTNKKLENNDNKIGTFSDAAVDEKNKVLPLFQKQIIYLIFNEIIYLGFKENIRGEKLSPIMDDIRSGLKIFVGFEAKRGKDLYPEQEANILMEVTNISKEKPEVFIQMIEALCNRYIPQYYNEIKRLEVKHDTKI